MSNPENIIAGDLLENKQATHPIKSKPILVMVNPHSGRGRSASIYEAEVVPFLASHAIEHRLFITNSQFRVKEFIQLMDSSELCKYKSILIVSGDGLVYETINSLMSRHDWQQAISLPLSVIPTGSGNGLAYTLIRQNKPDIKTEEEAIRLCLEQAVQDKVSLSDLVKITYGQSNVIWSFLSIGWGLLSDIDIDSEWLRRLGELRFTIYGLLRAITHRTYQGKLSYKLAEHPSSNKSLLINGSKKPHNNQSCQAKDHPNQTHPVNSNTNSNLHERDDWIYVDGKFTCLYAVCQSYISRKTRFSPKSTLSDDLIYLTYITEHLSPCKVVEFLLAIEDGSHEKLPYVNVVPVTSFKLEPLQSSRIVVDGEVTTWNLSDGPLNVEIVPKILKLLWKN